MEDINKTISEYVKSMSHLPIEDLVTSTIQVLQLALLMENNKCTNLQLELKLQQEERKLSLKLLKDELSTYYGYNNTEIFNSTFSRIYIEILNRRKAKQKFIHQWGGPPAIKDIPIEYKNIDIDGNIIESVNLIPDRMYYTQCYIQIPNYKKQKLIIKDGYSDYRKWVCKAFYEDYIKNKKWKYDIYSIILCICQMYIIPSVNWTVGSKYKITFRTIGIYDPEEVAETYGINNSWEYWDEEYWNEEYWTRPIEYKIIWKDRDTLYDQLLRRGERYIYNGICTIVVTKVELINDDRKNDVKTEDPCAVCCDTIEDPVFLSCMHKYCKKCVNNLFKHNTRKCPLCRTDIQVIRITDSQSD